MPRRPRCNHTPNFRVKVALGVIKGEGEMAELSQEFNDHANQVKQWKGQLLRERTGFLARKSVSKIKFRSLMCIDRSVADKANLVPHNPKKIPLNDKAIPYRFNRKLLNSNTIPQIDNCIPNFDNGFPCSVAILPVLPCYSARKTGEIETVYPGTGHTTILSSWF